MSKLTKNKLKTASYTIKRLRDNGFIVIKAFAFYAKVDPRTWTIIVNPGGSSVFITCYFNKDNLNEILFELNDGGQFIPRNMFLKTDSIEVLVQYLLEHGVINKGYYPGKRFFIKQPALNNSNEGNKAKTEKEEPTDAKKDQSG
mgnify:CR=1 FL=1